MTLISGLVRKALWLFLLFILLVVGAALIGNLPAQFRDMRQDAELLRQSSHALNIKESEFRKATQSLVGAAASEEVRIRKAGSAKLDEIESELIKRRHDAAARIRHDRFGWVTDPNAMLQSALAEKVEIPLIDRSVQLVQIRSANLDAIASEGRERLNLSARIRDHNNKVERYRTDREAWKRQRARIEAQWRNPICKRASIPGLCTLAEKARAEKIKLERRRDALDTELEAIHAAQRARASFRLANDKLSDVAEIGRNAVAAYSLNAANETRAAGQLWWNWWLEALGKYGLWAGWILLTIVFLPIIHKGVAFWIIGPFASRAKPLRLGDGGEPLRGGKSRRVLTLSLDADNELFVRGGLQTSGSNLKENDRPVLFWRKPFLCASAGLVRFERYRAVSPNSVTVTAYNDYHHVMAVEIPVGGAVTLHARAMVGLIKRRSDTVLPYRLWRASQLLSWMKFRFGYVLFPGPCTLIVQGKGGVYVQDASDDRSIDGRLTLGFDKGVSYGIVPSMSFGAYRRGERGLFMDRFAGGGSYIYQAQQSFPPRGPFWARGVRGIWDVALSVMGI
jgi:hypothetical protein